MGQHIPGAVRPAKALTMRSKTPEKATSAHLVFAKELIHALAGGGRLQGEFRLGGRGSAGMLQAGLYYIEDVPIHAATDVKATKGRIRTAIAPDGDCARVRKAADFRWVDEEIRARSCTYLLIQPFNILLVVEAVLSYEDVQSRSPIPLWGSVSLYRDKPSLEAAFDSQTASTMREVLGGALKQARSAIGEIPPRNRIGAVRKLEGFTDRIRSTLTTED